MRVSFPDCGTTSKKMAPLILPLLLRTSPTIASPGYVDASWVENKELTQKDFVHDSCVLESVLCAAGSSLPCGTDHHARNWNGVAVSYSKLCNDLTLRCTRREIHFIRVRYGFNVSISRRIPICSAQFSSFHALRSCTTGATDGHSAF